MLDEDDYVYDNYVETTIDPGNTLFNIALFISIASIAGVPFVVRLWRCFATRWDKRHTDPSRDHRMHDTDTPANATTAENMVGRRVMISQGIVREARTSMLRHQIENGSAFCDTENDSEERGEDEEVGLDPPQAPSSGSMVEKDQREICDEEDSIVRPESLRLDDRCELESCALEQQGTQEKADDISGGDSKGRPSSMSIYFLNYLWKIVRYDNETHRLVRLVVPFTLSSVANTASNLVELSIISQTLGTDAMIAYVMVQTIVGISSSFFGGFVEAVTTLSSMAYGAENYKLAGQYVQAGGVLYVLCEVPLVFVWRIAIGKIILLMGFDELVAALAEEYVLIQVAMYMMNGMNESFHAFLQVIEREKFANFIYVVSTIVRVGLVALFAFKLEASLVALGLVMLTNHALLFCLFVIIPMAMGWSREFEAGLFGKCVFRDVSVVKDLLRVAVPLGFGSLLAYAEWEILTVFAAVLGPAEAATWAIMGYVWGVFESTTEAAGDAAEVRVAYQLGKGRPAMAKIAGYKSMFLAFILSIVVSIIFTCLTNVLPPLLTHDETIQDLLVEMFPLVALGNVTMSMGMVCWAVVGAQGRYRLSTSIAIACSFVVTVPIGAVLTIWMRIDLQGLTFAVVTGYSATALLLTACIQLSDWVMLSNKIQEKVSAADDSSVKNSPSSSQANNLNNVCYVQDHDGSQKSQVVVLPSVPTYDSDDDFDFQEFLSTLRR
jgi:MATE family multidrug resistance protein